MNALKWILPRIALTLALALAGVIGGVMLLVFLPAPKIAEARDVYGFAKLARPQLSGIVAPQFYRARDGAQLAYRFYDSPSDRIVIFVHGSSYHGGAYQTLAEHLSSKGIAKVFLPNLRGHYLSGDKRGDVEYIGQLEDDVADLIAFIRERGQNGPIVLGGHSSGGGFAIRFAGGSHHALVSGYLLLSPALPLAPTFRTTSGGWATADVRRIIGLTILNAFHFTALNGEPVVWFNKPAQYCDGTETLVYSYRLNESMHPRYEYGRDISAMGNHVLVMAGTADEQMNPSAFAPMFAQYAPAAKVVLLPDVNHLGIIQDPAMLAAADAWLKAMH